MVKDDRQICRSERVTHIWSGLNKVAHAGLRIDLLISVRGACWTPRDQVECQAFARYSTELSATSPAASTAGHSAPPTDYRKSRWMTPANPAPLTGPGPRPSWPRPDGCNAIGPKSAGRDRTTCRAATAEVRGKPAAPRHRLRGATDPTIVRKSYTLARKEFRLALLEVVVFHHPGSAVELEKEGDRTRSEVRIGPRQPRQGAPLVDEAIDCQEKAIVLDPKLARTHGELGICLIKRGRVSKAIASYKKAVELGFAPVRP